MAVKEWIDSVARILDRTKRTPVGSNIQFDIDFEGEGPSLSMVYAGPLSRDTLASWCEVVRSEYRARKESQGTSSRRPPDAPEAADGAKDGGTPDGGAGAKPVPGAVPDSKETLYEVLAKQKDFIQQSIARNREEITRLQTDLDRTNGYLERCLWDYEVIEGALRNAQQIYRAYSKDIPQQADYSWEERGGSLRQPAASGSESGGSGSDKERGSTDEGA